MKSHYDARDKFFSEHKAADGLIICAETGERIRCDQAHTDHRPPMTFEVIVTTFLNAQGLRVEDVAITSGQDDQTSPELTDCVLREASRRAFSIWGVVFSVLAIILTVISAHHLVEAQQQTLSPKPFAKHTGIQEKGLKNNQHRTGKDVAPALPN